MLQTLDNVREAFLCPQCHQDMANMETLQLHFQNEHAKQSSNTVRGIFSTAKQKFRTVQVNFKTSTEPTKIYAPYFPCNSNDTYSRQQQHIGYARSYTDYFRSQRMDRLHQIANDTGQLLLRLELLTNTNEHVSRKGNAKERRKHEQSVVRWMEDSVQSTCSTCSKTFGIAKRKHHCRLDGSVICNPCSQFLTFSIAQYLIDPKLSSSPHEQLTSVVSSTEMNGDHLRICPSCGRFLGRVYKQIRFKQLEKDELFHHYDKIVQAQTEYQQIQPVYLTVIDSLLNGSTKYPLKDAQDLYRQLSLNCDKIDSFSKLILKLPESSSSNYENDVPSKTRYQTLCRNIRVYATQVLQNYAVSTRRVPSEDDVQKVQHEKQRLDEEYIAKLASNIPGINPDTLTIPEELEPFVQQYYQVIRLIQQAKLAGRNDEAILLESNLKELELIMKVTKSN